MQGIMEVKFEFKFKWQFDEIKLESNFQHCWTLASIPARGSFPLPRPTRPRSAAHPAKPARPCAGPIYRSHPERHCVSSSPFSLVRPRLHTAAHADGVLRSPPRTPCEPRQLEPTTPVPFPAVGPSSLTSFVHVKMLGSRRVRGRRFNPRRARTPRPRGAHPVRSPCSEP